MNYIVLWVRKHIFNYCCVTILNTHFGLQLEGRKYNSLDVHFSPCDLQILVKIVHI